MDRQRNADRDQQIARIREIFESSHDLSKPPVAAPSVNTPDSAAVTGASGSAAVRGTSALEETGAPLRRADMTELLGEDLGPIGRTPRARVRIVMMQRPAIAFSVVAFVAAAAAAAITWLSMPTVTPVDGATAPTQVAVIDEKHEHSGAGSQDGSSAQGGEKAAESAIDPDPAAAGGTSDEASIVVSVVGTVATPGLVSLPAGARVSDAITAAGGALPGTDLSVINLARKLSDGEQIAVGVPPAPDASGGTGAGGAASDGLPAKVNINSASAAELDELPGIGPVLAGSIVSFRDENGPFAAVEELANVSGIGPATLAKLKDLVTV